MWEICWTEKVWCQEPHVVVLSFSLPALLGLLRALREDPASTLHSIKSPDGADYALETFLQLEIGELLRHF